MVKLFLLKTNKKPWVRFQIRQHQPMLLNQLARLEGGWNASEYNIIVNEKFCLIENPYLSCKPSSFTLSASLWTAKTIVLPLPIPTTLVSVETWLLTAVLPANSLAASTDMAAVWAKFLLVLTGEQLIKRPLTPWLWNVCSLLAHRCAARVATAPPQNSRFITIGVRLINETMVQQRSLIFHVSIILKAQEDVSCRREKYPKEQSQSWRTAPCGWEETLCQDFTETSLLAYIVGLLRTKFCCHHSWMVNKLTAIIIASLRKVIRQGSYYLFSIPTGPYPTLFFPLVLTLSCLVPHHLTKATLEMLSLFIFVSSSLTKFRVVYLNLAGTRRKLTAWLGGQIIQSKR